MSDSILNASISVPSSNPKDFSKKKRANRSAQLKQSKLDVRREQWLSHVKKRDEPREGVHYGGSSQEKSSVHLQNTRGIPIEKFEIKMHKEEIYEPSLHHYSDSESLHSGSPTSHTSSILGSNDSGVNFTASSRSSSSSGRSSSNRNARSSSDCEDGGDAGGEDDDCLDDWETVADALESKDDKHQDCVPKEVCDLPTSKHETAQGVDNSSNGSKGEGKKGSTINCCAWRPGDACRPHNLPNLSKQYSFPLNSERNIGRGSVLGCKNVGQVPTSCPICFEDFDCTDLSFLPCSCGFRLCLFCHKRIVDDDGRCPGCRKKYEYQPVNGVAALNGGNFTFRLSRSCTMIERS